jgi:23S rRNA (cytosine1962-C5)-methyltransferase
MPSVAVNARGAARLRAGHPWVLREDLAGVPDGSGDLVRVTGGRGGELQGTGLWSARSRIALRMVAKNELTDGEFARLLDERIAGALARRRALLPDFDAYRVVHGEADRLPGLFVDRYRDVAVVQTTCAAMDAREAQIGASVAKILDARLVVARDDGAARDFEELPRRKGILCGGGATEVSYHDAGSAMTTDVLSDGKTGGFLDQQENHAVAARYATRGGAALDAFSYHGGFALALARAGMQTVALDESAQAVERIRKNASDNAVSVDARCENAFDALRQLESEGRRFDLVVIDPPALAKRKSALPAAERGYKELNLRGLRLLNPGGILVTCSCSGKLTPDRFARVVEAAARDVGRPLQLLERRAAGRDHPPLLGVPETDYLKCWILRVLE